MSLTHGAVQSIFTGAPTANVVLQVFEIRKIAAQPGKDSTDRYKMKISDGTHVMQAMLMSSLNDIIYSGELEENGLLRVQELVLNKIEVKGGDARKICILLKAVVAGKAPFGGKVGNPVAVDTPGPAAAAAPPSRAPYSAHAGGAGPVVPRSSTEAHVVPVRVLNPYNNAWTIKVRVTRKLDKRTWSNARGEGQLFSVELVDKDGTAIRATFFRDAVDKFYDVLQENNVYLLSRGKLKPANTRYTSIPHQYEIAFGADAMVEVAGEDPTIQHAKFTFTKITDLPSTEPGSTVDAVGIVKECGEVTNLTSKAGRELTKRDLTLMDTDGTAVRLTLWGERAEKCGDLTGKVLAASSLRVGDYGGRSLSTGFSSTVLENPDLPEAHALQAWWAAGGESQAMTSISDQRGGTGGSPGYSSLAARHMLDTIKAENLGSTDERGDIVVVKATINFVKNDSARPPMYPACNAGNKCQKKAVKSASGDDWTCESCSTSFPEPSWRYIVSVTAVDHTGSHWVTLFNETAVELMDRTPADSLHALLMPDATDGQFKSDAEKSQWEAIFQAACFKSYVMRLRVKQETINDGELRQRVTALALRPIDYAAESRVLLNAIKQYDTMA